MFFVVVDNYFFKKKVIKLVAVFCCFLFLFGVCVHIQVCVCVCHSNTTQKKP